MKGKEIQMLFYVFAACALALAYFHIKAGDWLGFFGMTLLACVLFLFHDLVPNKVK